MLMFPVTNGSVGTLTLFFSHVGTGKTFTTEVGCDKTTFSSTSCIEVDITSFTLDSQTDFHSQCSPTASTCVSPFATLNLSVR
jgi:hypothetical protein